MCSDEPRSGSGFRILVSQDSDDRVDKLYVGLGIQNGDLSNHQLTAGREQFARTRVAVGAERPESKLDTVKRTARESVARDLAEDPVVSTRIRQGDGRTQLCLREIREREGHENYRAG